MSNQTIPIRVASQVERQSSWEGISTPYELAIWLSRILSIDASKIAETQEIIYSDLQPTGNDQNKIWIKTSEPIGLGLPTGDVYSIIYQYPPGIPLLWTKSASTVPQYMRELSETELTDYKLTAPDKGVWVIFNP